jgi:hypothetical protein
VETRAIQPGIAPIKEILAKRTLIINSKQSKKSQLRGLILAIINISYKQSKEYNLAIKLKPRKLW